MQSENTRRPRSEGETVFGSATARAVEHERKRLGLAGADTGGDWAETWGRRIGRGLAIGAFACVIGWLAFAWITADAQTASWTSILTERDERRVENIKESRQAGLQEASTGDPKEYAVIRDLLEAPVQPIRDLQSLRGAWRCRTIKLGGGLPAVIYAFFDCRITETEDAQGLLLEKPTGSQRKRGLLRLLDDGRMLYAGTSYYDYTEPRPYGADPETDEAGILMQVSPDRLRLELPQPTLESKHDVIELVRKR